MHTDGVQTYWIGALLVGIVIALFAVQNSAPTSVHFLWLNAEGVPVSVLIMICAALGAVVTVMLGLAREVRLRLGRRSARRTIEAHEKRLAELTSERDTLVQEKASLQAQLDSLRAESSTAPLYEAVPVSPPPLGDSPQPPQLPERGER
jgi:uncharacterized integral membrane protein